MRMNVRRHYLWHEYKSVIFEGRKTWTRAAAAHGAPTAYVAAYAVHAVFLARTFRCGRYRCDHLFCSYKCHTQEVREQSDVETFKFRS